MIQAKRIKLGEKDSQLIDKVQYALYWACEESFNEDEELVTITKNFNDFVNNKLELTGTTPVKNWEDE